MSVAIESYSTRYNSDTTSFVGDKPAGTVDGNLLVALIGIAQAYALSAAPEDWEQISWQYGGMTVAAFWKIASSEPDTWTWTLAGNSYGNIIIPRISGHDPTNPINANANTHYTTSDNYCRGHSCTTDTNGCLILSHYHWYYGADRAFDTGPSGWDKVVEYKASGGNPSALYSKTQASYGATGDADYTYGGSATGSKRGCQVAIKPAAAAPTGLWIPSHLDGGLYDRMAGGL